jgi:GAF domain-containing protein
VENQKKKDSSILLDWEPLKSEAPAPTSGVASRDLHFTGESTAFLSSKALLLESMFNLLIRDIKFADFMREIVILAMAVVKSEAGSILEMDYRNDVLFFRAMAGRGAENLGHFTVPKGQGIAGFVAESLQVLVVSDAKENQMHLKSIAKSVGFDARNLLAAPIVIRGKIFGVLELLNRVGEKDYSPSDIELMNFFCNTAARAIEIRMMLSWARHEMSATKREAA